MLQLIFINIVFIIISQVSLALFKSLDKAISKGTSLKLHRLYQLQLSFISNGVSHQPCILL